MLPIVEEKKLQELITDMCAYMRYLREGMHLYISVHQIDQFMRVFMHEMKPYNNHDCPYCIYMKSQGDIYNRCVERQKALCARLRSDEPFFGTCWLGVGEYVFPLIDRYGTVIGFISISGYKGDAEKAHAQAEKVARRYDIPIKNICAMQDTLKDVRPDYEEISAIIKPLVHMFTVLQSYIENYGATFAGTNPGESDLFDNVCSFLRSHFSTDYRISELARHFAVSESSLSRLFSTYSDYSYRGYVNAIRVNIGKVYLENTDMTIRELSEILGYSTPNYFTSVFEKACGMTPEKYRMTARIENGFDKLAKP